MEFSYDNGSLAYPDQEVLRNQWKTNISPPLIAAIRGVASYSKEEAREVFTVEMVNEFLVKENSPQKVFDIYGLAQFLGILDEIERQRDLLLELSKIVPYAEIDMEISVACSRLGDFSMRFEYIEKAHKKMPENPEIWNLLGASLMSMNQKERGLKLLRQSVDKAPSNSLAYSNYLFYSHLSEEFDNQKLFEDHRGWSKVHADKEFISDHANVSDQDRKLRIGYISPDYRIHPVGILMKPIINLHDRESYEVFGYGNVLHCDKLTEGFEKSFDHYRNVLGLDSKKTTEMILDDKIDILIDLSGHTGNNRLDVMACKPAPVQVTYLGYFDTTGMDQVDYFLTDSQMSPPESQQFHTEELFCMPSTCLSYNVLVNAPDVVPSPVMENGFITFGMYSNPSKITRKMARLWSRILESTKNSRLKMILKDGGNSNTISVFSDLLQECGVPMERVDIQGKVPLGEYFPAYNEVDIMLDTYPYNGGMTTCDAFWMGVPIVTLVGEHHFSRVGLSLLSAVGLDYFAAKTEDEYVAKATVLAAKPEALTKIRNTIRQRMLISPLANPRMQTRNIENAYREMWRRWCRLQNEA